MYGNSTTRTCEACDLKCLGCTGYGENNCLACNVYNLVQYYLLNNHSCVDECPNGTVINSFWKMCEQCYAGCLTCVNIPTECTSCKNDTYLQANNKKVCISDPKLCDKGFYANASTWKCEPCHTYCSACFGPEFT